MSLEIGIGHGQCGRNHRQPVTGHWKAAWFKLLFVLGCLLPGMAQAARTVNSVTLNGATAVTVATSASITTAIRVTTNGSNSDDNWRSTGWWLSSSANGCVDHANYNSDGTYNETFTITAPSTAGTYTAYFAAYNDDSCSLGESAIWTMNNAVTVFMPPPTVSSINLASPDPAEPGNSVSWTVTFNRSVSGVDAADFALVAGGGVTGAAITAVTGSGATRTVTATTGSGSGTLGLNLVDNDSIVDGGGLKLGGTGTGNGNFTGQAYTVKTFCSQPANTPAGLTLTCVCDTFGRASLNPSTIFGANWIPSTSDNTGILPGIVNPGYLRLTNNTGDNAKAVTVPGIFPAAGNYISVEFRQYAYNGSGADGIAVTLSDYAVPPVPGAFGGSLGYAPKTPPAVTSNIPGFAGGWIGVAMDEFGNYQNPTEGRIGGPGAIPESVAVRGSGAGITGYRWLKGTSGLSPLIDNKSSATPSPGYYYQVIVDATDPANATVAVNRDTSGTGTGYASLINPFNVFTTAIANGFTQAAVPDNWQISFTGSTGGSTNIHEIAGLRICAQTVWPPSGGTAAGFSVIDEAYGTPSLPVQKYAQGHIYMKLAGTPFKLNVAALNGAGQIQTGYAAGGNKSVTLKLVDNSDGVCVLDSTKPNYCSSACTGKAAVAGGSQTLTFAAADKGEKQSASFTLNSAYRNLAAIVSDGSVNACSVDAFSVRPTGVASVASSNADMSKSNLFKAGSGAFSLTATTTGIAGSPSGYNGKLKINSAALQPQTVVPPADPNPAIKGMVSPAAFPNAATGTPSSIATDNSFTYSEVGTIVLPGYDPAVNTTSLRGVFDGVDTINECNGMTPVQCDVVKAPTWSGIDSVSGKKDCIADSYANVKYLNASDPNDSNNGKYGCNFGLVASSAKMGRFIPDHFDISAVSITPRSDVAAGAGCTPGSTFTYIGEPFRLNFTLQAMNAGNAVTKNYTGAYAKLFTTNWLAYGTPDTLGLWMMATGYPVAPGTCKALFSNATPSSTSFACDAGVTAPAAIARAAGPRVTVVPTPAAPNWIAGQSAMAADLVLERADKPDGPYATLNIGIAPQDLDGVTIKTSDFNLDTDNNGSAERKSTTTTEVRYGRLLIPNMYGSELLDLRADLTAQYWGGSSFRTNTADSCTAIPAANFSITSGQGNSITTAVGWTSGTLVNGGGALKLNKPSNSLTNKGSIILRTSTTAPAAWPIDRYLPGSGVETFGVFKSGPVIYLREVY
ncbi:MAG TPA: DUF6701 domain-containing protein [Burkholderiaceae bacterium]|nr:DUF6701 domain-containing protein [Burkholderiaceae bacterium]